MEIGGEMGQPRVMPDEALGMCDDSSHRKKVKILEHPKSRRATALQICHLTYIRWSTDDERRNSLALIRLQKIGKQPWSHAFMEASAPGMDDHQSLRGPYSNGR